MALIVRKPDLGVTVLRENPLGLDHGLNNARVEGTGGHLDPLLPQYANPDRVPIGTEVAVEVVGLSDDEGNRADEIQERTIARLASESREIGLT